MRQHHTGAGSATHRREWVETSRCRILKGKTRAVESFFHPISVASFVTSPDAAEPGRVQARVAVRPDTVPSATRFVLSIWWYFLQRSAACACTCVGGIDEAAASEFGMDQDGSCRSRTQSGRSSNRCRDGSPDGRPCRDLLETRAQRQAGPGAVEKFIFASNVDAFATLILR